MESPWDGGTKVCSNGPGHMTKMATMPIYGKNIKKSSPEPKGWWPWNLVCSIGCSGTTKYVQMMTLDWPWPILRQGHIWSLMLLYGEKGKTMDFYAPPPESGGVLCYTLRNFECPSVCPSVRPSAPTTILVSATPPTVLGQSFWNFTGVLRMVWRYAYCFFRILKLFFITFFPFLT